MMALNLKEAFKLDKSRRSTVYGYIREYQASAKIDIPEEIILVCVVFYGNAIDAWDPEFMNEYMEITGKTIEKMGGDRSLTSSFCKRIVETGIFKWKIKMNNCMNDNTEFLFGIWKIGSDPPPTDTFFTEEGKGYAFSALDGALTDNHGAALGKEYGVACDGESTIEMILDLDELTLSYIMNGVDYGKAFDVEKSKYRAAIYLYNKGASVTLIE